MMIPVRCISCGKPVGHLWEKFKERVEVKKEKRKKVFEDLKLNRYCCRSLFMGHVDLFDTVARFKRA